MKHTLTLLAAIATLTACDNSHQPSTPSTPSNTKVIGTLYTPHLPRGVYVVDYSYYTGAIWAKTESGEQIYASNYTLILTNKAERK